MVAAGSAAAARLFLFSHIHTVEGLI